MPVLKVSHAKVGPSPVVNVDMGLRDVPVLPNYCPCCCALADEGEYIVARCKGLSPVSFPACADCARHTRIENKAAGVFGPAIFFLTLFTVAAFFFLRGISNFDHANAGPGWQLFAGLANLRFPFSSWIHFGLTALGGFVVLIVYLFIYKGLMHLVLAPLNKASCKWFHQAARTEQSHSGRDGKPQRRFIFENPAYATHFIKANGGEPNAP